MFFSQKIRDFSYHKTKSIKSISVSAGYILLQNLNHYVESLYDESISCATRTLGTVELQNCRIVDQRICFPRIYSKTLGRMLFAKTISLYFTERQPEYTFV